MEEAHREEEVEVASVVEVAQEGSAVGLEVEVASAVEGGERHGDDREVTERCYLLDLAYAMTNAPCTALKSLWCSFRPEHHERHERCAARQN